MEMGSSAMVIYFPTGVMLKMSPARGSQLDESLVQLELRVSHNSITNRVDLQFFMADPQFFGVDPQFFGMDLQFFAVGLLLSYKLCIFLLLDYFHPINYGFVSCLLLTEHVQTLYWACVDIIDPVCDRFDG